MSTKSNGSSSNSETPKSEVLKTYDLLLGERESLLQQRELVSSRLWDYLRDLWQAERQQHLEALLRTGDEAHRVIALFIGEWLEVIPVEVEAAYQRQENPEGEGVDTEGGGSPWMESDGESADDA